MKKTSQPVDTVREFHDRLLQLLFENPLRIKEMIAIVDSTLAEMFDYSSAELLNRSQLGLDLALTETDILIKIAYIEGNQDVLIYILLENQTTPDRWMGYRILDTSTMIWRRELSRQRDEGIPESEQHLVLILPIVLYTGKRKWDGVANLTELMNVPDALTRYVPTFQTLFLNLQKTDIHSLTGSLSALALKLLRAEDESSEVFMQVLEEVLTEIGTFSQVHGVDRIVESLLLIAYHRRPENEKELLYNTFNKAVTLDAGLEEMINMGMTIAERYFEDGMEIGFAKGKEEGKLVSELDTLLSLGEKLLGKPSKKVKTSISSLNDASMLKSLMMRLPDVSSWDELLGTA